MLKWLKNAWPWSSENPNDAIWPKDFKANDVKAALDKQAPRTAREARLEALLAEDKPRKPALKKATTRSKTLPLKKSASPKAFKENNKTEVKAGKPVKQAVAISYAVKKEATKKTKGKK